MSTKELVSVALRALPKNQQQFYAVLSLRSDPVNALNLEVWAQLLSALHRLEADPKVRGLILTSGVQKDIFTAGNDLMELYAPKTSQERYTKFWTTQTKFLAHLYRSRLVTMACIRGHSPAGGCGMALCCDYRIMTPSTDTPGAKIGLNEVAIGILVPKYWAGLMVRTIGCQGRAEKLLLFGQMVTPEEALKLGMVDELSVKAELLATAEKRMQAFLQLPDLGRQLTKGWLRDEYSRAWEAYGEEEAKMGYQALSSPAMVKALGGALVKLGFDKSKL